MTFSPLRSIALGAALVAGGCGQSWGKFWDIPIEFSFAPVSGPIGTLVKIQNQSSADFLTLSQVTVGGREAVIVSKSATDATVLVMPGTTSGPISLSAGTRSGNSAANFSPTATGVVTTQQGAKLVGSGNIGAAAQGQSVALSADGNTAIIGGSADNSNQGAAWVWVRSGTTWTEQGAKLVGTGSVGAAGQGTNAAISADGNTAIIAGAADNSNQGAAWIWVRSGTTWTQQGAKLVGTGNTGAANQGSSIAISADGNTAIIGGSADNTNQGAAWVWVRSGTTWTQQGAKLVGTGNTGAASQGIGVALSADGNTAIIGGSGDNTSQGAAWVWVRSGTTWTQQGAKLVGTGNTGAANQGLRVALSADGNTAIVGGFNDNTGQGAAWVWVRSGSTWTQQGAKLVGTGNTGAANQGYSVALSADGNIAIITGEGDNTSQGAFWVWLRSGTAWTQQGGKLVGTGNIGAAHQGRIAALSADGNTAIIGGAFDNSNQGAAWIWVP